MKQCPEKTSRYIEIVKIADLEAKALSKHLAAQLGTQVIVKSQEKKDYYGPKSLYRWGTIFKFYFPRSDRRPRRLEDMISHGALVVYDGGLATRVFCKQVGSGLWAMHYQGLTASNLGFAIAHLAEGLPQAFEETRRDRQQPETLTATVSAKWCIEESTSPNEMVEAAYLEIRALAKRMAKTCGVKVETRRKVSAHGGTHLQLRFADRADKSFGKKETVLMGKLIVYDDSLESVVNSNIGGSKIHMGLTADSLVAALIHLEEHLPNAYEEEQASLEAEWRFHARALKLMNQTRGIPESAEGEIHVEKAEELRAAGIAECRELVARLARPGFRASIAYTPPNFYPGGDHRVEDGRSSVIIMGYLTGGEHLNAKDFSDPLCSITRSSPGSIGELGFYYNYHYAPAGDEDADNQEGEDLRRLTFGVWTPQVWKSGKNSIVFPGTTMGLAEALMYLEESINVEIDHLLSRSQAARALFNGVRESFGFGSIRRAAEDDCQQLAKTYGYTLSKDLPAGAMLSDYERSRMGFSSNFSLILKFYNLDTAEYLVHFYMLKSNWSHDPALRETEEIFRVRDNVAGQPCRIQEFPATPLGLANALVFTDYLLKDLKPPQTA